MHKFLLSFIAFCSVQSFLYAQQKPEVPENITITEALIPMPDGDSLSATIALNKDAKEPLPAALVYNIYATKSLNNGLGIMAANSGYAGIVVNTRGKKHSKSNIDPFKHDAEDAWYMLDWISKQSWCNGSIGMFGGSYLGFSQWAAAKSLHPALKTIVPQAAVGIGIDFPMHNGVFSTYSLGWLETVMAGKEHDFSKFAGEKKWIVASNQWHRNGLPYKALDSISEGGVPNPVYREWLQNPAYSEYWQKLVPYKEEFVKIKIPILTTTGYFDADQLGALYYYKEHLKYNPGAEHYLIMGPYDHAGAQGIQGEKVLGYTLPDEAHVNFYRIIFKWFDYVLKGKAKPEILKDKVNYQVVGTTEWKSAASLAEMSNKTLKFYLSNEKENKKQYKLVQTQPLQPGSLPLEVDFSKGIDYGKAGHPAKFINSTIKTNGLLFVSQPLTETLIVNGNISGELNTIINIKDMDITVELFEVTTKGDYIKLSDFLGRASYIKNRTVRQLLTPGVTETLSFSNAFMISKKVEKGSRLAVVVNVNKNRGWQVNYGTGNDVSNESRNDAAVPLKIQWLNSSYINVPVLTQ